MLQNRTRRGFIWDDGRGIEGAVTTLSKMKTRLASLLLLFGLTGSAFAVVPLQFGGSECSMTGMDMDCCKSALTELVTPEIAAARLACELACAQPGTTFPSNIIRLTPPAPEQTPIPQSILKSLTDAELYIRKAPYVHDPPGSPPAYLLNLTFLI